MEKPMPPPFHSNPDELRSSIKQNVERLASLARGNEETRDLVAEIDGQLGELYGMMRQHLSREDRAKMFTFIEAIARLVIQIISSCNCKVQPLLRITYDHFRRLFEATSWGQGDKPTATCGKARNRSNVFVTS